MSDANFQGESNNSDVFDFNDRYGVRSQRAWVPYALSFAIIGGAWLIWAGVHHAEPEISHSLISFNNADPRNTEIRYTIARRDPSQVAICIIAARDLDKVIVGQIVDHIPATSGTTERTVRIPSRADAVNAGVETCYLD
ncbi:unannotated protein [freshwater metagenome]|uniref:Unannotated protein n=1 Tax=freshwater metagenome TaxID=449393 RepID=A0A6J7EXW3_9ZZZZ|nr:DUF4307 domain-containing protein [Actinomycetota bacterium]